MPSSHEEDLLFFGESIPSATEVAQAASIKQKSAWQWDGHTYRLESDYDPEERQVCITLYRNDALLSFQPAELTSEELNKPLSEQVQIALDKEFDFLQAAFRLTKPVKKEPRLLNGVGLFFYTKNLWPEAEELFLKAIDRKRDFSEAYKNLSQVYLKLGLPQKAVRLLEDAVNLNPNFADLHNALAWVYLECSRLEEARLHLAKALGLNPNYQEAHLNLCLYYLQTVMHSQTDLHTPAPAEAIGALRQAANPDAGLSHKIQKIFSWDDASQLYLILKDRHNRRDTINIRALCELTYARFLKDRNNLPEKSMSSLVGWLEYKIKQGYDYPDLRNYLGTFCAYWGYLQLERAKNNLQLTAPASADTNAHKEFLEQLHQLGKELSRTCEELMV